MNGANYKIVEFFFSSYRLEDIQLRIGLVSPNFNFSSPLASNLNFIEYHKLVTIMRNNTTREVIHIHTDNDIDFKIDMKYHIVENSVNYVKNLDVVINITFDNNLIDVIKMDYELTELDKKVFGDIKMLQQ